MILQIQTLLITYSSWHGQLKWLRYGARQRSVRHVEILANIEPSRRCDFRTTNLVSHQNVTNILTTVHAAGGHFSAGEPTVQLAFHMDFVQDFLSNTAMLIIHGMLPLVSKYSHGYRCYNLPTKARDSQGQYYHTGYPSRNGHAACQTHRSSCESKLSRSFHAWTRAVTASGRRQRSFLQSAG